MFCDFIYGLCLYFHLKSGSMMPTNIAFVDFFSCLGLFVTLKEEKEEYSSTIIEHTHMKKKGGGE